MKAWVCLWCDGRFSTATEMVARVSHDCIGATRRSAEVRHPFGSPPTTGAFTALGRSPGRFGDPELGNPPE